MVYFVNITFEPETKVKTFGKTTRKDGFTAAAAAAKSLQSCLTLWDPIDRSPPGSIVPGILQAWTLEWVAVSFSSALKWKVKVKLLSCVRLLATPWTAAHQAPPSMGFSRQDTGVGCHWRFTAHPANLGFPRSRAPQACLTAWLPALQECCC